MAIQVAKFDDDALGNSNSSPGPAFNEGAERRKRNPVNEISKQGFWHFVKDAFQKPTKLMLLSCACASLGLSVLEGGITEAWHDIGGIFVTVLVALFSAFARFLQERYTIPVISGRVSPLQSRTVHLASWYGIVAAVIMILDVLKNLIGYFTGKGGVDVSSTDAVDWKSIVRCGLTIFDGLSLAINAAYAFSARGMNRPAQFAINNSSVMELIGSITVICSDMTVEAARIAGFDVVQDLASASLADAKIRRLFSEGISINTAGGVLISRSTTYKYSGCPMEKALLDWGESSLGMEADEIKRGYTILHAETFESTKTRSGVLVCNNFDNSVHVHVKGAPERVLQMCSSYYRETGSVEHISHNERKQFETTIQRMGEKGLCCIAFAHKEVIAENMEHETTYKSTLNGKDLTLMGFVGIKDPSMEGLMEDISTYRNAGVGFKMLTPDDPFTATIVARRCGITDGGEGEVVDAEEFSQYTEEEKINRIDTIQVLSRASSSQKIEFIKCLQRKGHVVAMISKDDGALKKADVGVFMARKGINVSGTYQSSSVVIFDANPVKAVLKAVIQGRRLHNNIRRYIQFLLPANIAALAINFISSASGVGYPLTAAQVVWVNLIMVIFGVLNLAIESPMESLMHTRPACRHLPLITNIMWRNMFVQSVCQLVILSIIEFKGRSIFDVNDGVNDAIVFNTYVLFQLFNLLHSRHMDNVYVLEGLLKNLIFLASVGVAIMLQIATVQVVMVVLFAEAERLSQKQWGFCVGFAAISLPTDWVAKCIKVPTKPLLMSYVRGKLIRAASVDKLDSNDLEEGWS